MKKYTANYAYTNHNFVIQNLPQEITQTEHFPAICILKNILQRATPTHLSKYLQERLGAIHKDPDFSKPYPLISSHSPKWERIIRGDIKNNNYPAKSFFETAIPKHFPEFPYMQQLIIPEVPLNHITQQAVDEFAAQQVDFYLPQAFLVIEIDGYQHDEVRDNLRDDYLSKYGIMTVRITTTEVETENNHFLSKVASIKQRINNVMFDQNTIQSEQADFISFEDYRLACTNLNLSSNQYYKATSIIRFQILLLELLLSGKLSFNNSWSLSLYETELADDFADLAFEDLCLWFEHIFKLQKIAFHKPTFLLKKVQSFDALRQDKGHVKVDFSILKRYTDEFQNHADIVFVRTDYFDYYRYYKQADGTAPKYIGLLHYDYFEVSIAPPVDYNVRIGGEDQDEISLLFLLGNIFFPDGRNLSFKDGQLSIIANALSRQHTLGLLPTGGGKSVCYQLPAILQPAISIVICPIKSLMRDQQQDLALVGFTRVNRITSEDDAEDKERIQQEFAAGKYFFILVSPERFQNSGFRVNMRTVNQKYSIAYAVIDEVHCLSEWGHDFRTSYLNLSTTLGLLFTDYRIIGLTATASLNVLKDIKIEFNLDETNIKTLIDYTRPELEFEVVLDKSDKYNQLCHLLNVMIDSDYLTLSPTSTPRCGLIFTQTVNGDKGCHSLSNKLSNQLHSAVEYFSGTKPKVLRMTVGEFDAYKQKVQDKFKNNESTLLVATKSFGMGINKGNVYFTIHYGLPGSMEALYQEGGRAGRDKSLFSQSKAKCYVLFTDSKPDIVHQFWDRRTKLQDLKDRQKKLDGDLNTNFFLMLSSLDPIKTEFNWIMQIIIKYGITGKMVIENLPVKAIDIGTKKAQMEKALYRLKQLGIVSDWTVKNFFAGEFVISVGKFSEATVKMSLIKTIRKYDVEFEFNPDRWQEGDDKYTSFALLLKPEIRETYNIQNDIKLYIFMLLVWAYEHIVYNRKQSLMNLYDACLNLTPAELKKKLEGYFKMDSSTYILQHISEHPHDYKRWFSVLYKDDQLIDEEALQDLQTRLSRFLESFEFNSGLNFLSGLIRLLLNNFRSADGKPRLEAAFAEIKRFDSEAQYVILDKLLMIAQPLANTAKFDLVSVLYSSLPVNESLLSKIRLNLGDAFLLPVVLPKYIKRLTSINEVIYAGFERIR